MRKVNAKRVEAATEAIERALDSGAEVGERFRSAFTGYNDTQTHGYLEWWGYGDRDGFPEEEEPPVERPESEDIDELERLDSDYEFDREEARRAIARALGSWEPVYFLWWHNGHPARIEASGGPVSPIVVGEW